MIWDNRKKILEGIKNSVLKSEDIEKLAEDRMNICRKCELLDTTGEKCMIPGTAPCCGACGCKLSFKIRSLSSECADPAGARWKAVTTPEEEDKVYKDINYNPDKI